MISSNTLGMETSKPHILVVDEVKIAAGETATIPAGVTHFQKNDTEEEVEAIEEYRPAKQMQEFFEVLIGWANDGKTNDAGMPSMLRAAVMHRYFKDSIRSSSPKRNLLSLFLAPIGSIVGYRKEIEGRRNIDAPWAKTR